MARGLIHRFDETSSPDDGEAQAWLGGKGASLARMTRMGLPVPEGFTLGTDVWRHVESHDALPGGLEEEIRKEVARLGDFGSSEAPLLLSVRSGGPTSMPGMLETVLNVGVNAEVGATLESAEASGARFGLDVRRRFVESYASVVLGVPQAAFDALLASRDVSTLDEGALRALLTEMDELVVHEAGEAIPDDPWAQLFAAIRGVSASWRAPRAQRYREAHGIDHADGTAVTIQRMVFGNLGPRSAAGVVYSRNPSTGEGVLYGEWLHQAQGEDVVSGRRTPRPLTKKQVRRGMDDDSLESAMPGVMAEIRATCQRLEEEYRDVVDVEITVERGRLFVLQCRQAKRTARAAARIAVEMQGEGALSRADALRRVDPASLRQLLTPRLPDPEVLSRRGLRPMARGLAASPGAASGRVVFDAAAAAAFDGSEGLVLVRAETSAEDVDTMRIVNGILTAAGGLTSHAAVVARAMGKPCVAGATSLHVDYVGRRVSAAGDGAPRAELQEGDLVTIDGARGLVYGAAVPVEPAPASPHVESILEWADEVRRVRVLAEASSPRLAIIGRSFGADGVFYDGPTEELDAVMKGGPVLVRAAGETQIADLLGRLRADTDGIVVDIADVGLARSLRGDGTVPIWSNGGTDADGFVLGDPTTLGEVPAGAPVAFRGADGGADDLTAALGGQRPSVSIVVPPLDVAIGRLFSARVTSE